MNANPRTLYALGRRLVEAAKAKETVTYGELGRMINVSAHVLGQPLGQLSRIAIEHDFPGISALVVSKDGIPGEGFYDYVGELMGYGPVPADQWVSFFESVRDEVWERNDWDTYLTALSRELGLSSERAQAAATSFPNTTETSIAMKRTIELDLESEQVEESGRKEGGQINYYGKRYERDPMNRQQAIALHGTTCKVCGFDFEEFYGPRGKDFIEIHHKNSLGSQGGKEQTVNPATDLAPLCANCHRMIHRRHDDVLTVEQLREIVLQRRIRGTKR